MEQWSLIATAITALVSIGLFSTKADVERLRAEVHRYFVPKDEMERVYDKLDTLHLLILSMKKDSHS